MSLLIFQYDSFSKEKWYRFRVNVGVISGTFRQHDFAKNAELSRVTHLKPSHQDIVCLI